MPSRLFRLIVVICIFLTVAGSLPVLAETPTPPPHDPIVHDSAPAPAGALDSAPAAPVSRLGSQAPAVALGRPGLSFAYQKTYGTTGVPYVVDNEHLNTPAGLFIDSAGGVYIVENEGSRLLRYNSSGENTLSVGKAGVHIQDGHTFSWPEDVALDPDGNIWVVDEGRVIQFDPAGAFLQALPAGPPPCLPEGGNFCHPGGVAFDAAGRMFIADSDYGRILVFTFSGGVPQHQATIDQANLPGGDNATFDHPTRIAVDGGGRLFVADTGNHRIQVCEEAAAWACASFHGTGAAGSQTNRLSGPRGVSVDAAGNVYIADTDNARLKKCTPAGVCSILALDLLFWWPTDVAVNSSGDVFVADYDLSVVARFSADGVRKGNLAGQPLTPYLTNNSFIHAPNGLAVDAAGSLYVTEERGNRLLKLNAAGAPLWSIGQAGIGSWDDAHFGAPLRGGLAFDAAGHIFVPDTERHRVQIFNPNGTYFATLGTAYQAGSDNSHFRRPNGVAINPVNGDIYVADRDNQRIQVFNPSRSFKASIGTVGLPGSGNNQFDSPSGVAVDRAGNLYVADRNNHRVQKFSRTRAYLATLGVTGQPGDDYSRFNNPQAVAVDQANRVYVADSYNHRVLVYDANGAFLTVLGQWWGEGSAQMRYPSGVTIGPGGCVFVAERDNHRIQKFCPTNSRWIARNSVGFGNRANGGVAALEVFNAYLYAGAGNASGAQLYRSGDGATWQAVQTNGFGDPFNISVDDMAVYNGRLYASTDNYDLGTNTHRKAQVYRSSDGLSWSPATPANLDDNDIQVAALSVFEGALYAATAGAPGEGAEIWRTTSGAPGDWARVANNGFGDPDNYAVRAMGQHSGYLYAGTDNPADGAEVWRSDDGLSWSQTADAGFGGGADGVLAFEFFDGWLYAGVYQDPAGANPGGELWRCQVCDGDWEMAPGLKGFGDANNGAIATLTAYRNRLYAATYNPQSGTEIWSSAGDLSAWQQENEDGFGSAANYGPHFNNGAAIFQDALYLGVVNPANGGAVWVFNPYIWQLPVIYR